MLFDGVRSFGMSLQQNKLIKDTTSIIFIAGDVFTTLDANKALPSGLFRMYIRHVGVLCHMGLAKSHADLKWLQLLF